LTGPAPPAAAAAAVGSADVPRPSGALSRAGGACFHCGAPNPPAPVWRLPLDGEERTFCCAGCMGVARTIRAAGLEAFYLRRTVAAERRGFGSIDAPWNRCYTVETGDLSVINNNGLSEPLLFSNVSFRGLRTRAPLARGAFCLVP